MDLDSTKSVNRIHLMNFHLDNSPLCVSIRNRLAITKLKTIFNER
jgi:hypothetical protein